MCQIFSIYLYSTAIVMMSHVRYLETDWGSDGYELGMRVMRARRPRHTHGTRVCSHIARVNKRRDQDGDILNRSNIKAVVKLRKNGSKLSTESSINSDV